VDKPLYGSWAASIFCGLFGSFLQSLARNSVYPQVTYSIKHTMLSESEAAGAAAFLGIDGCGSSKVRILSLTLSLPILNGARNMDRRTDDRQTDGEHLLL
jgi:hypothetical protein